MIPGPGAALRDAIHAVAAWPWSKPRLVLAGPVVEANDVPVLSDMNGKAHGAYDLEGRAAFVLLRPDGHTTFRADDDRVDELVAHCRKVLGLTLADAASFDARAKDPHAL